MDPFVTYHAVGAPGARMICAALDGLRNPLRDCQWLPGRYEVLLGHHRYRPGPARLVSGRLTGSGRRGLFERDDVIRQIKTALESRSGKKWRVTHGRGTASYWLRITAPPERCDRGVVSPEDQEELRQLLGVEQIGSQGVSVPDQDGSYQEFIDRAEGREPSVRGAPNWD